MNKGLVQKEKRRYKISFFARQYDFLSESESVRASFDRIQTAYQRNEEGIDENNLIIRWLFLHYTIAVYEPYAIFVMSYEIIYLSFFC